MAKKKVSLEDNIMRFAANGLSRSMVASSLGFKSWASMVNNHPLESELRAAYLSGETLGINDLLTHTRNIAVSAEKDSDQLNACKYLIDRVDRRADELGSDDAVDVVDDASILASIKIELSK